MPEDMPDRMPEDMPDRMPEDMSDRMPEDLPVTKCINVMVGITRSRVIELLYCYDMSLENFLQSFFLHFSGTPAIPQPSSCLCQAPSIGFFRKMPSPDVHLAVDGRITWALPVPLRPIIQKPCITKVDEPQSGHPKTAAMDGHIVRFEIAM